LKNGQSPSLFFVCCWKVFWIRAHESPLERSLLQVYILLWRRHCSITDLPHWLFLNSVISPYLMLMRSRNYDAYDQPPAQDLWARGPLFIRLRPFFSKRNEPGSLTFFITWGILFHASKFSRVFQALTAPFESSNCCLLPLFHYAHFTRCHAFDPCTLRHLVR